MIYSVSHHSSKHIVIYKNNKKNLEYFNKDKIHFIKAATIILRRSFKNDQGISLSAISSQNNKFVFKIYRGKKYLGKYTVSNVVKYYNRATEDDSLYQLASYDHPQITA